MMAWINLVVLLLAVLFLILAFLSALRAGGIRPTGVPTHYNVGKQQARVARRVAWLRTTAFAVVGVLFILVWLVLPGAPRADAPAADTPAATATGALPTATPTVLQLAPATATVGATPTDALPTAVVTVNPTATDAPDLVTLTPTPADLSTPTLTPTPTLTATVPQARVAAPFGLFLRDVPGGSAEVELLLDGTIVQLLGEMAAANGFEWQRVRTPAGNEGWVAAQFLTIDGATP